MNTPQPTAVFLMQMGGPRGLDEIPSYIEALFNDPDLVRLPWWLNLFRRSLSKLVARRRSAEVASQYSKIGGSSPNNGMTQVQASLLEKSLAEHGDYRCFAAMAYTEPLMKRALAEAKAAGCQQLVAISMFPQYSTATTLSCMKLFTQSAAELGFNESHIQFVDRWSQRTDFRQAIAARVSDALESAALEHDSPAELLISAHGIPVSYIEDGDPYLDEVRAGHQDLIQRFPDLKVHLSFQSRSTRTEWVSPSTVEFIEQLGKQGVKNLVVLPLSFVSDHLETLYEIDVTHKELARAHGIEKFRRVAVFNDGPDLTAILKSLLLESRGI